MKQIIKLQKEQLKVICKGVGIDYEDPQGRYNELEVEKELEDQHESDENFEGEKSIGWSMKGEK